MKGLMFCRLRNFWISLLNFEMTTFFYPYMTERKREHPAGIIKMLTARVEPEVKEQAEQVLDRLGIPMSNAVGMFLRQIVLQRGLPFEVKLPQEKRSGL